MSTQPMNEVGRQYAVEEWLRDAELPHIKHALIDSDSGIYWSIGSILIATRPLVRYDTMKTAQALRTIDRLWSQVLHGEHRAFEPVELPRLSSERVVVVPIPGHDRYGVQPGLLALGRTAFPAARWSVMAAPEGMQKLDGKPREAPLVAVWESDVLSAIISPLELG